MVGLVEMLLYGVCRALGLPRRSGMDRLTLPLHQLKISYETTGRGAGIASQASRQFSKFQRLGNPVHWKGLTA